jgi:hypothetical protein
MEQFIGKSVLMYLLMPLIGIIFGVVMMLVAKKNNLLKNKKLIFYLLLSCIVLASPALLGFIDYWFMPKAYILLAVIYLILGYLNLKILGVIIDGFRNKPYYLEFLFSLFVMLIGAALFSLVFNLCNELQYGLWACTCTLPFIFPSLFGKAYHTYLDIPVEVYKIWSYANEKNELNLEYMNSNKIIVVELELFRKIADTKPLSIRVKASDDMPFGIWFKILIDDYNRKSPLHPIDYEDTENSYGWLFYVNTFFVWKKHIDPDLSFAANKIKEKNCIIAKRVQQKDGNGNIKQQKVELKK